MSDPPRGTFLVTNWQLTNSLWLFFLLFPSLPTLCCFKTSIQSNDQSDQFWSLPIKLLQKPWSSQHAKVLNTKFLTSHQWLKLLFLSKCDLVYMWFAGALQWQKLFNFKQVREKLRGQGHSCTETSKDRSQNIYAVALAKWIIIKFYYMLYLHAHLLLFAFFKIYFLEWNYKHFYKGFGLLTSCVTLSSGALPFWSSQQCPQISVRACSYRSSGHQCMRLQLIPHNTWYLQLYDTLKMCLICDVHGVLRTKMYIEMYKNKGGQVCGKTNAWQFSSESWNLNASTWCLSRTQIWHLSEWKGREVPWFRILDVMLLKVLATNMFPEELCLLSLYVLSLQIHRIETNRMKPSCSNISPELSEMSKGVQGIWFRLAYMT